ncbi:MAG: biopolymer transporter ExbD [Kiritimatiellia bacterium]
MLRQRLTRKRKKTKLNGDINMTPILDMTFLLLIAFIITFPALQSGVTVKLPTATGDPLPATEPISITIRADGHLFLGNQEINEDALYEHVAKIVVQNPDAAAHIRGDEAQSYGRIMDVIKILRRARLNKFSLVTESE